jgi:hypothetical protein
MQTHICVEVVYILILATVGTHVGLDTEVSNNVLQWGDSDSDSDSDATAHTTRFQCIIRIYREYGSCYNDREVTHGSSKGVELPAIDHSAVLVALD